MIALLFLAGVATPTLAAQPRSQAKLEPTHTPSPTSVVLDTKTPSLSVTATSTPYAPPVATPLPMIIPLISSEPTPAGYGPVNFPAFINPLTGTLPEDVELLDRRPMVVKITNYPRTVRPQSGLSKADLVYEYYMERGVPRFIAVFYGEDAEKVGPVRSGRLFDRHIYTMYDGIFVFGSADNRVLDYLIGISERGSVDTHIYNSVVLESSEDKKRPCDPKYPSHLCRDFEITSYNNMFTNTSALQRYITRRNGNYRPALTGMHFSEQMPAGGNLGLSLSTRYSLFMYNKWEYDISTGKYLRYQEDIGYADPNRTSYVPHIDALTNQQISADNVVVLIVPHNWFVKTPGTEMMNISLLGRGTGYVFRNGFVFPITWIRPADNGIIRLYSPDGEPFPLKPGKTWYQVISQYSTIRNDVYDWYFVFNTPPAPEEMINPEALNPPTGR